MKQLFLFAVLLCAGMNAYSNIYTVNNQSGFDADYSDIQSAIAAVSNGDTIYVQPSSVGYGAVSITKQLYIIGGGHNPDYSPYNSAISNITLGTGASGCVFKGLYVNYFSSQASSTVNDVLVSGCYLDSGAPISFQSGITYNNWIWEGNVITCNGNYFDVSTIGANWIFRNNFFQIISSSMGFYAIPNGTLFDHNIIYQTGAVFNYLASVYSGVGVVFKNNIFVCESSGISGTFLSSMGSTSFQNNLTYAFNGGFPDLGPSNITDVVPAFVDVNGSYAFGYNKDFHLQNSSPGNDAATDGTDIGIYGGIFNFSMFGFDAGTPRVEDFTLTSPSAPAGGTITIHLKAHGSGQ